MTTNIVAPIAPFLTEDGIELYTTDTGTGVSMSAAAIFYGVNRARVTEVVAALQSENPESLKGRPGLVFTVRNSKILKPLLGKNLFLEGAFLNGAKPLRGAVFARLCRYFAEELDSEKAQYSLEQFEEMGVDSWIRQTTGHAIAPLSPLESAQQMIIGLQADLLIERGKTATTAKFIAQQGEGLSKMFDRQDQVDEYLALPAVYEDDGQPKSYTLRAYLEEILGIESVHKRLFFRFANLVSFTSKTHAYANPRQVKTAKGPVNVYTVQQFPLLQSAWEDAMRQEKDMRLKGKTSRREVLNPKM